jgi:hypothetical protein
MQFGSVSAEIEQSRMRYKEWQNITSGLRGSDNLPVCQRYSDAAVKNYLNEQATQGINTHRLDLLKLHPEL